MPPKFKAHLLDEGLSGGPPWCFVLPLGPRESEGLVVGVRFLRRGQQQCVGGDGGGSDILNRVVVTNLGFANPEESFLVAEVDFDVPPHDVSLEDGLGVCIRVGADKKGGPSVEVFPGRRGAVAQRGNDDEFEVVTCAGRSPA